MNYERKLLNLYTKNQIISDNTPLRLHSHCQKRQYNTDHDCWSDGDGKITPNGQYQCITRPFVGRHYKRTRILILGKNHRDDGKPKVYDCHKYEDLVTEGGNLVSDKRYYSERYWILDASKRLKEKSDDGNTKLVCKGIYEGLFTYAYTLVSMLYNYNKITGNIKTSKQQAEIAEYIAWTQTVKCNPRQTERQIPTHNMWSNCPDHILREELTILNPKYLVVLGADNYHRVLRLIIDMKYIQDYEYRSRNEKPPQINYWRGKKENYFIHIIGLPHPSIASNGGGHRKVARKLRLIVQKHIRS